MHAKSEELISENTILNNAEEVLPPTYYEVNKVIEKLKIRKAAGSDSIPAQLIKQGGTELKRRIYKLALWPWQWTFK